MSTQYTNPPVETAVCEFRFAPNDSWDLASPGLIYSKLMNDFPIRLTGGARGVTLQFGPEGVRSVESEAPLDLMPPELRFWHSDDNSGEIVVAPFRLAVHHRRPYPSWGKILPVIQRAFEEYVSATGVDAIQRIGLRYVNRISFGSGGKVVLEDHFNFYPFLGDTLPQEVLALSQTVEYEYVNERDRLRLQLAAPSRGQDEPFVVRLDLDYFLAAPGEVLIDGVIPWLEYAHEQIEAVFEGCLKESVRSTFENEAS